MFQVPIALGTIANLEQEMSAALAPAHQQAVETVRQAPVKYVDETGWKQAGRKRWLWAAATTTAAVFIIDVYRCPPVGSPGTEISPRGVNGYEFSF